MLLIKKSLNSNPNSDLQIIPMTVIDINTGKELLSLNYQTNAKNNSISENSSIVRGIEFIEHFNEWLMIKHYNEPLKIYNIISQ